MKRLPDVIAQALERAKRELGGNVTISRLNGHYYLYRRSTRWDKDNKRVRSSAEYLGRITDSGAFIGKGLASSGDLERARELILSRGGSVTLPGSHAEAQAAPEPEKTSDTDRKIITTLSMNSRANLAFIGKSVGLKPNSTYYRIKQLEERYGIRYIMELNPGNLGYQEYLGLIRFVGKRPDTARLREAFSSIPNVQLALLTSGRYDMLVHFVARNNDNASSMFYKFLLDKTIGEYDLEWAISPFFSTYCFVPLRDNFYELLKEKIWKRSKETPRLMPGQITSREHAVLQSMNSNANIDFTSIDKAHGLERGTARYTYHRLVENGTVVRPTITMQRSGVRYNAVMLISMINGKLVTDSRERLLFEIIDDTKSMTNKYALVGNTGAPSGALFICPIRRDGDLQRIEANLLEKIKGSELITLIVTEALVGNLCYRSFDNMHSRQYKRIIEDYKRNLPQNKVNYDDTGREKTPKRSVKEEPIELDENETD